MASLIFNPMVDVYNCINISRQLESKLKLECFRKSIKAIEAAIHSRQWSKVIQIVEAQEESVARKYYKVIADHYAHVGELAAAERSVRQPFYV